MLTACGSIGWIVDDVVEYLAAAQADDLAAGKVNLLSGGMQFGSI